MQVSTPAIVLRTHKYSETSIIAKLYTQKLGLTTFIVHGVRKKHSKISASLFQPLQLLHVKLTYKERAGMQSLKDINISEGIHSIHSDIFKSSIAMYIAELIYKVIKEEEANENLFQYLYASIAFLNEAKGNYITNFHLLFTLDLSRYLGFYPTANFSTNKCYFILEHAKFESAYNNSTYFNKKISALLNQLMQLKYDDIPNFYITTIQRRLLLKGLLSYYQYHLPEMGTIQSIDILETLFT